MQVCERVHCFHDTIHSEITRLTPSFNSYHAKQRESTVSRINGMNVYESQENNVKNGQQQQQPAEMARHTHKKRTHTHAHTIEIKNIF